ncbi:MAG TPA: NADH-quinone oxidoreductase subunit J [Tepidisphaeraceae bacterium]|nr:NADH-quinone oxidoreductase subunit J [Tepidisphaeraceae bacterium]
MGILSIAIAFPRLFSSALPGLLAAAEGSGDAPAAPPVLAPGLILAMCILAGIGTLLLLPGRRDVSFRRIGGALAASAGLIFAALLLRNYSPSGIGIYFWVFAIVAILGAMRVITHPKPVYSALYFVLTVFASAGLFVLLDAEFMAAALVVIYAGAILITYVFVIMLAAQARAPGSTAEYVSEYDTVSREPLIAAVVGFALMGILLFVIFDRGGDLARNARVAVAPNSASAKREISPTLGATQQLGIFLFQQQTVQLELAGLLLTVSMVGAIVIARKRVISPEPVHSRLAAVTLAPATPISDDPYSIPVYGTDNPRQKAYPQT